ncbi:hypothetical protein HN51_019680 [Arachis hypogaea]|uniref:GRF-type domain-containing protein n=1 Tax=Arachis hypogaea TaxID=3818 RepID=A0A445BXU3_ARAHY|nr:uncharacterized protein LOC112707222 [Arachis hypogaea]QHO31489.1 uncharacterized protein DS421_8g241940 [Arachis hypogaea]RYR43565.1 hypothetical protein Ahy_A08g039978 [Arachis hypogaea]
MASGGNSASSYCQRVIRGSGDGSASSASGGPKFGIARGENPRCHCGAYAIVMESGTDKNPRRPFFGCPYYTENLPHCEFFIWFDKIFSHEMQDSQHNVVLEERVKKLKDLVDELEKKTKNISKRREWSSHWKNVFFFMLGFLVCIFLGKI